MQSCLQSQPAAPSPINSAAAAREILRRRRARTHLLDFIVYMDPDYIVSEFSEVACQALEEFIADMVAGLRPVLILQAPPQHGKSQIVSRCLPAWVLGKYPDWSIGGLSYGKDLAADMNRDVQRIMLSDEYHNLFPASSLNAKRMTHVDMEAKRNSDTFEIVGRNGRYIGAGVGGPLTGKRLDLGIIDDPIKNAKEALSHTVKDSIYSWYQSTFLTRLSKNGGQIIMATSWAQDDLSGRVAKTNSRAKVLKFQAINEKGEALVPELHPIEKLLETKAALGDYFWSAMYQQSPKAIGGTIFKDHGIRYYLPKDLPKKFDKVIISWDMTFKDTDGADFVVGQVWGKSGANAYLLDQVRERMAFTATKNAVIALAKKWPDAKRKLVEDKANGPAVIDALKNSISGLIPVEPDGSKIARAHAVTAEWEAGNVWLPSPEICPWVTAFVEEITTFPAAANDDQVDSMTQALRDLYSGGKGFFG